MTVPADPPPAKVDFRRTFDGYHAKFGEFRSLVVPPLQYLMVDGRGDPNQSTSFGEAVSALYPVAYAMKFTSKQELGRDYVVPPLEGLWWAEDMNAFTGRRDKSAWSWTLMLLTPDWLDSGLLDRAIDTVSRKKSSPARLEAVRLSSLDEGLCVQTLHLGPFDDEAEVLRRMHEEVIPEKGLLMTGRHHEIYLSDRRRVSPSRMRTILRQPVLRVGS